MYECVKPNFWGIEIVSWFQKYVTYDNHIGLNKEFLENNTLLWDVTKMQILVCLLNVINLINVFLNIVENGK